MKKSIACIAALALAAFISGPSARAATTSSATPQAYGPPPPQEAYPNEPWANPPEGWQRAQQKGFRDGVKGAYRDAQNHRPPNVENRDEYRHPDVPHRDRRAYRRAFRHGYWTGVRHLMGYYHGRYPDDDDDRR